MKHIVKMIFWRRICILSFPTFSRTSNASYLKTDLISNIIVPPLTSHLNLKFFSLQDSQMLVFVFLCISCGFSSIYLPIFVKSSQLILSTPLNLLINHSYINSLSNNHLSRNNAYFGNISYSLINALLCLNRY